MGVRSHTAAGLAVVSALPLLVGGCSAAGVSQQAAPTLASATSATPAPAATPTATATAAPTDTPAPSAEPLPDEALLICDWLAPIEGTDVGSTPEFDETIRVDPDLEFNEMLAGYAGIQMEPLGLPLKDAYTSAPLNADHELLVSQDLLDVVADVMDVCRAGGWEAN